MWREKSAWYTLFTRVQTIPSIWSFTNPDMNAPRALNCARQCFVSTHVSLGVLLSTFLLSTLQQLAFRTGYYPVLSVQLCWGEKRPARSASGNLECICRQRGQSPVFSSARYVCSLRSALSRKKEKDFSAPKPHLQPHPCRIIMWRHVAKRH